MEPLERRETTELLRFFRRHKAELSCLEQPAMFLGKMRDCDLIPEDRYKKVSRIRKSERRNKAIYDLLDWFEKERAAHIRRFWTCVLQETLLQQCPTLRRLHSSLMEGSFQFDSELPESRWRRQPSESEAGPAKARDGPAAARRSSAEPFSGSAGKVRLRMKRSSGGSLGGHQRNLDSWVVRAEKQTPDEPVSPAKRPFRPPTPVQDTRPPETSPGVQGSLETVPEGHSGSSHSRRHAGTPGKKKTKSKHLAAVDGEPSDDEGSLTGISRRRADEKDIWTWPIYKSQLPVTCGNLQGKLHRKRLSEGLPCVFSRRRWYTPTEFEGAGGKMSCKNWKTSIRCESVTLDSLIKAGHLHCGSFRRRRHKREVALDSRAVFEVTCGAASGTLHKQRFASGRCGMCVRTEERWMTPDEFAKAAPPVANPQWDRDILWAGRPLSLLVEREVLRVHPAECFCVLCKPSAEDLESQRNDDSCCVCQGETEALLVVCDQCPRAFHQLCHLPRVDGATLRDDRKWLCTFCIFKNFQGWCHSDETRRDRAELLGSPVSRYMMQCQFLLLDLYTSDGNHLPPGHKTRLSGRLQDHQFQTIGEFESEVTSLLRLCHVTHQGQREAQTTCAQLQERFSRKFEEVFRVV